MSGIRRAYEQMCSFDKLYEAHVRARKGKRGKQEVIQFELKLSENLVRLQKELLDRTYRIRGYRQFEVYDPKRRTIHALDYRDRIVQHSLCDNIIAPYMEKHLIYDNAAGRSTKGTHFAMDRLELFLHKHYREYGTEGYFLKFDIRHYFDSIDHEILKKLYQKVFADERDVYWLISHIIDSYGDEQGKGIPLGNQTSCWFASWYLDGLDRLIKEKLGIKYYSRYMDDGILVHHDKKYLKECLVKMERFINDKRKLCFNQKTQIVPLSQGVDYLGFHFYLTDTGKVVRKLRMSNKKRIKRKLKRYRHAYRIGKIDMDAITRSLHSYRGHLSHGDTWHLQKTMNQHLILSKQTLKERQDKIKGASI